MFFFHGNKTQKHYVTRSVTSFGTMAESDQLCYFCGKKNTATAKGTHQDDCVKSDQGAIYSRHTCAVGSVYNALGPIGIQSYVEQVYA